MKDYSIPIIAQTPVSYINMSQPDLTEEHFLIRRQRLQKIVSNDEGAKMVTRMLFYDIDDTYPREQAEELSVLAYLLRDMNKIVNYTPGYYDQSKNGMEKHIDDLVHELLEVIDTQHRNKFAASGWLI
jgi:hypothetical protein